ncbi:MAG: IMP dehydrogenase [Patescibacteria group bacterium]
MARFFEDALTYDDVLLVPRRSSVSSRSHVSTETWLTPRIRMNVPIVSANMDTVTEWRMAVTMARLGGIGIIHRFLSIEDQVVEVEKVKRIENFRIERPYTLTPAATLRDAREAMRRYSVSCLLIAGAEGKLAGLLSNRDIRFETDERRPVTELMTPRERLIVAHPEITLPEARELLRRHKYEKLPLVDENGALCGLITSKDIVRFDEYPQATKDEKGRLRVGAALGVKDTLPRAEALLAVGADVLVVDVAHGHNERALAAISALRARFGSSVQIIGGNIATPSGARDLVSAGADAVKVGIGPGTTCTTRIVAGVGVPQLTAVLRVAEALAGTNIPVIADGGIRYPGDLTKAMAAGAGSVMLGGLLAGTDESPGVTVMRNGRKYKIARGMASLGAAAGRRAGDGGGGSDEELSHYVAEGIEAAVPYRGKAEEVVEQLMGGLRSGMSYCNARTIGELQANAGFVRITDAGRKESLPHDVEVL